ncbi:lipase [Moelleriella libera RCEF 2490]|uniref:Lipase n=1 Tax=Moelleriella libera RCEF 2490 TaxID=1081109 RepID=A0A162IV87_9HYPO|nr:lipase [Moelleriella libera RCEF 2490]
MAADLKTFIYDLAVSNLERFSEFEPPATLPAPPPDDREGFHGPLYQLLEKWSKDNIEAIQAAVSAQVFGKKEPINWKTAFLPFMESMAVYCRDYELLVQAWRIYRGAKRSNNLSKGVEQEAVTLYLKANHHIDELAAIWGLNFVVVCDLVNKHPKDHCWLDGPYCGAFYTKDEQKSAPFIGLAFKGTNPFRPGEDFVDLDYDLMQAGNFLDNTHVSEGVFTGLFGTFEAPNNPPYVNVREVAKRLAENMQAGPVPTHVTGHSLGGSYSQFLYAQLLIDVAPGTSAMLMGDEYTFGAPRVGSQDWAVANKRVVGLQPGLSWRIANDGDPVPKVPPTTLKPTQTDFYHVDSGFLISDKNPPAPIPSEIGGPPPPVYPIDNLEDLIKLVWQAREHLPSAYYHAMLRAMKG